MVLEHMAAAASRKRNDLQKKIFQTRVGRENIQGG
jgi:hypothetical protein